MRKFSRHNLIVNLLAFLALMLAVTVFSDPKIRNYNWAVKDQQNELLIKANGTSEGVLSFSTGNNREGTLEYNVEIATFIGLFLSLILTKRIIFSLLAAFVFIFEFVILHTFFVSNIEFPYSYFHNYTNFTILFVIALLVFSHWQSAIICRFSRLVFMRKQVLK